MTFRPIGRWPGKLTAKRKASQFRSGYGKTLDLLDHELRALGASSVVLQVALAEQDIRLDGKPRAGAKASHPGVILTFESRHGPLNYPCDTYDHWQDNLHAVALSLQALRAVNRYGVTAHGEQYRGFAALPPAASESIRTEADAREFFWRKLQVSVGDIRAPADLANAYRRGVMALHPDRGGDPKDFDRLQQAKAVLDAVLKNGVST